MHMAEYTNKTARRPTAQEGSGEKQMLQHSCCARAGLFSMLWPSMHHMPQQKEQVASCVDTTKRPKRSL